MYKHLSLLLCLATVPAYSQDEASGLFTANPITGESAYDKAWSLFTLYKNAGNPVMQEFSLQGRLQVQYADGDSNGHYDIEDYKDGSASNAENVWGDHFEVRRARLGFKSKWYQNWKFEGQIDSDLTGGIDEFYRNIYDLYLTYAPSDALNVTVGKTKVKFGREQEVSSKEIVTIERSLMSNLMHPGELTGVTVNGKNVAGNWLYELGVHSNEREREFSSGDGGVLVIAKAGYDYAEQAGLDTAVASIQYLHNSEPGIKGDDVNNFYASGSPSFTDCVALTNDISMGRFGLITDILYGFGYTGDAEQAGVTKAVNQSDVFGISLIPTYFIADGLQLVGRLQWAGSADGNGLALAGRYEKWAPVEAPTKAGKDAGNSYASAYLGLNYYLYGHKLKLMNGVEYSHLGGGDYDGYAFLSGLRFSF